MQLKVCLNIKLIYALEIQSTKLNMTSMIDISIEIWFRLFINADNDIYDIILNM